jgi:hypothetical protein
MTRPHDLTDLFLAPVALAIDTEIESLERMTHDELLCYIPLVLNREPRDVDERRRDFVEAVTRHHDLHGWRASCEPRGLRLRNGEHTIVLGLPPNVRSYLGLAAATATV